MTLRQFRVWQSWLDLEAVEVPSTSDLRVLQVAVEVKRIAGFLGALGENPKQVSIADFLPQSQAKSPQPPSPTLSKSKRKEKKRMPVGPPPMTANKVSQMRWFSMMGGGITKKNSDGTYTLPSGKVVTEQELNEKGTKGQ